MSESGETKATERPEPTKPEFKPEFYWAFVNLMLWKLGGIEAVTIEWLEQFKIEDVPDVYFDGDQNAYVMKLKDKDMPKKVIVPVSGKILKRQRRLIKGRLS